MKKTILFLVLAAFLISACSQQKPDNMVGGGSVIQQGQGQQQTQTQQQSQSGEVKEFKITAKQFQFDPATIEVSKGDKVRLLVTSTDVPHGFSIAEYGINVRVNPGKTETVEFTADKQGTFTAFCSVFCGSGHSNMKGKLIVK